MENATSALKQSEVILKQLRQLALVKMAIDNDAVKKAKIQALLRQTCKVNPDQHPDSISGPK